MARLGGSGRCWVGVFVGRVEDLVACCAGLGRGLGYDNMCFEFFCCCGGYNWEIFGSKSSLGKYST